MNLPVVSFLKRGSGVCLTSQDEMQKERRYKTLGKGKRVSHSSPGVQKGAGKLIRGQQWKSGEGKFSE